MLKLLEQLYNLIGLEKVRYSKEIRHYSYQSKCNSLLSTSDSHHHEEKWRSCSCSCSCSLGIIVEESGRQQSPRSPLTGVSMFSLCLAGSARCVSWVTSRWSSTKWNLVSGVFSRLVLKAVRWNRSVRESLNVAWLRHRSQRNNSQCVFSNFRGNFVNMVIGASLLEKFPEQLLWKRLTGSCLVLTCQGLM